MKTETYEVQIGKLLEQLTLEEKIGTIVRKDVALSRYGKVYMEALKKYTGGM